MTSRPELRAAEDSDRIGSYRLLRLLGRGGMGDVYLAWSGLRLVAIKILHSNYATDATFVAMFLAEARVAGRINHSSIAQVLDVGMDAGRLYMVMEYVAGHTLDDLINDRSIDSSSSAAPTKLLTGQSSKLRKDNTTGKKLKVSASFARGEAAADEPAEPGQMPPLFPMRIAASVFAQVAHALAAAHRAQIVHRDISPHNILVSDTGAIKLIDFGIARTQNSDVKTSPGTFRGRFGYMAPEYIQGRPCDHRVDLFALGVVMWETFTRRRLYPGAAAAQLYAVIEKPAERLDVVMPEIPVVLADVVEQLLEREPDDRYDHASEVAQTLEKILPMLPDGGFRNLAHWTEHHLANRIEARAKADHDDLQVVVEEEAAARAQQAADEPEIEMRSHAGSQVGVWPGATGSAVARLPPKLAFGLGMAAAALVSAAVALWVLVWRNTREEPPVAQVATMQAGAMRVEPIDEPSRTAMAVPDAAEAGKPPGDVPVVPLSPPAADAGSGEPELEISEEAAARDGDESGDDRKKRERDKAKREREEKEEREARKRVSATTEPARPVEVPKADPVVPTPPPPTQPSASERAPSVTTNIPQLAPPPPPPPSGPPKTPRVPATMAGDAGRGGAVFGQCNACHTEQKKKRVDGKQMTRSQWERFFRNGSHDRYRPLGDRMSVGDLAAAKAYLTARALDATEDQSAGVR